MMKLQLLLRGFNIYSWSCKLSIEVMCTYIRRLGELGNFDLAYFSLILLSWNSALSFSMFFLVVYSFCKGSLCAFI